MDVPIEFSRRWYIDDVPVTIYFGEIDGRLAPIRVEVGLVFEGETRDVPPKPITTGVWRRIPVTRLADRALLEFARDLREHLDTLPHPVPQTAATEHLLDVSEPQKKRPGRPRLYDDDHWREVLDVYERHGGRAKRKAVADHFNVEPSTASKWIATAKERVGG